MPPLGLIAAADSRNHAMLGGKEREPPFSGATMDGTNVDAQEERALLSGGAIASLSGVAVLAIFMAQNTDDVTVHFLVGTSPGLSGCSPSLPHSWGRSCGSAWVCCGVTGGVSYVRTARRD